MSFAEPIWLYLTPLMLLLFGAMLGYGFQRRDALLEKFAASRLLEQLTEKASGPRTALKVICLTLAVAGIGIALARPQYGVEWSERKARGLDIVFVLDSSKSMLANDLRPTRLDRAKLAIIDLVERLESDRIGLVAFAGQAFLQTPPTLDYSAFRESLDSVDPGIITSGGSDLGRALKEAAEAFPSENNIKVVVLLTDGEDLGGNAIAAAKEAQETGIQVFAIGIGTPEGEYLKIRNSEGVEEFLRDASGQPVLSQLDESTLQQIAQSTGGSYSRLSDQSLEQLYKNVIATLPRKERESEMQEIHIERFQWALALASFCLVLEILIRRRRSISMQASMVLIALLTLFPTESKAQTTDPEDARSLYNSAYEALQTGDYEAASQAYESALAQTDDLQLQRDALYNLGHASYQQGRASYDSGDPQAALEPIKKSEQLFASALEVDPSDDSIKQDLEQVSAVRKAIEDLLNQQNESSDDQNQESQDSEDSESDQENDDSQQGDSQQGDSSDSQSDDESQGSDQENDSQQSQEEASSDEGEQDDSSSQNSTDQQEGSENGSTQGDDSTESEGSEGTGQDQAESTQNPLDDIPQPAENEDTEEAESAGSPQSADGAEEQSASGQAGEAVLEGMSEADAAALLDSLRSKETLLPFIDQPRNGNQREIRDW